MGASQAQFPLFHQSVETENPSGVIANVQRSFSTFLPAGSRLLFRFYLCFHLYIKVYLQDLCNFTLESVASN